MSKNLLMPITFSLVSSDELVARSCCPAALNLACWRIFCAVAMTFSIGSDVSVWSHVGISLCIAKGEYLVLHHLAANLF